VIDVPNPCLDGGDDSVEQSLTRDQRSSAQVRTVQLDQIEGVKERPVSTEQQLAEVGSSIVIKADDLPVEDRGLAANCVRPFLAQDIPVLEAVPSTRDQFTAMPINLGQRPKPSSFSS
jgi:hypothetical protein